LKDIDEQQRPHDTHVAAPENPRAVELERSKSAVLRASAVTRTSAPSLTRTCSVVASIEITVAGANATFGSCAPLSARAEVVAFAKTQTVVSTAMRAVYVSMRRRPG
jgi:hypothetical protein